MTGDIGAVVHVYSGQRVLEVELVDGEGKTVAVETLPMSDVRPIGNHEIGGPLSQGDDNPHSVEVYS